MIKRLLLISGLSILFINITAAPVLAQVLDPAYRPINMPFGRESMAQMEGLTGAAFAFTLILQIIAGGLLYFAAPVAVIIITLSAFKMITGSHEAEKIEQAKKNLTWSIVGLFLIMFSYTIVRIIIGRIFQAAAAP